MQESAIFDQAGRPPALRVMTYNVHRCIGRDRKLDLHRTAEVIAACEPDIVALQELDVVRARTGGIDQARAIAALLGMTSRFHASLTVEEEKYGNAILTALPERLVKAGPLPGSVFLEPRGALWVEVEVNGGGLQIINTHLGLSPYERLRQARRLTGEEWLGNAACRDPVLLLGDLNGGRRSRSYGLIASRLRDAQVGRDERPRRTYPSRMPLLRLDHVFCSRSVQVLDIATVDSAAARVASDHLPLVADLQLDAAPSNDAVGKPRRHGLQASPAPSGSPR